MADPRSPFPSEEAELDARAWRELIDQTDACFVALAADGRVLDANRAYARLAGYDAPESVVGRSIEEWVAPEHHARLRDALRRRVEERHTGVVQLDYVTPGGGRRPVECRGIATGSGNDVRILALCRDLSGIRRTERELAERVAHLDAVLRSAVDGIVTIDASGRIETFNPAAERMFGWKEHEIVGQDVSRLMPEPHASRHAEYVRAYLEGGDPKIIGIGREVEGLRKDGTVFPIFLSVAEMRVEGQRKFSGLVQDLTDRKALERRYLQAQKMEAIGRLASGIAHDFNNLLMGILGLCRMASRQVPDGAPAAEPLAEIRAAAERGTSLTRQLLAFSRQKETEPARILLGDVIRSAEAMVQHLVGEDVEVRLEITGDGGPIIADPGQIEQVLMNLAVNARDAMPRGGVLSVRVATDEAAERVLLEVTDTGCGMDEETLARAFEPFFTTKPEGHGTGLGLATTYGIVRQLGGEIELSSRPGEGTTVRIRLPHAPGTPAPAASAPAPRPAAPRAARRVLLVEDDRLVRMGLASVLTDLGHEVHAASGPSEALERWEELGGEVDLVLTDVVMPELSGPELVAELRRRAPGVQVLFMSAFPGDVLVEQGRIEEGERTIEKPFDEDDLRRVLREIFEEGGAGESPEADGAARG